MFFMFLRDVYQHSNADDGRLTNSRVFFTDPFTRWAVFVYGQDMHIPHHLFPAVPHYRLRKLARASQVGASRLSRPKSWKPTERSTTIEGRPHDPRRDDPPAHPSRGGRTRPGVSSHVGIGSFHRRPKNTPAARMADARRCSGRGSGRVRPSAGCQRRGNSTGIAAAGIAKNVIRMPLKERRDDQDQAADARAERRDESQQRREEHREDRAAAVGWAATSRAWATPASAWDWMASTSPAFAASTRAAACSAEIIAF